MGSMVLKEFHDIQNLIEENSGIYIPVEKSHLLESRVNAILEEQKIFSFDKLYTRVKLENDIELLDRIIDSITTNETFWFRDKASWITFEEVLLPRYVDELRKNKRSKVRIWSCACSTGQEPYSIAIIIQEFLEKNAIKDVSRDQFEIYASDISDRVIQIAQNGKYDSISMERGISEELKSKYFHKEGNCWKISDRIKERVNFSKHNLRSKINFINYVDVVFCRYVFIYFNDNTKKEILSRINGIVNEEAIIFFGASEILSNRFEELKPISFNDQICYQFINNK